MTYFSTLPIDAKERRIGIVGFDGVATLDLTGPLETLARARTADDHNGGQLCYDVMIVGAERKSFVSESGVAFKAQKTMQSAPHLDTIIIPGGSGLRKKGINRTVSAWLASQASGTRRMVSVSTGIYALAETGFLNGRNVTTHWRFARDVAQKFPKLRVNYTASFLKDGAFYTCGGGPAGVEMTLALIKEDYGAQVALALARELVVHLRPPGEEVDCLDPSVYQLCPTEKLAELPGWILAHLHVDLSVDVLARRACLCPRHFSRVFKSAFKTTPAEFVEQLRLSEARRRLQTSYSSVESIATAVGYTSSDAFRRAFERRLGLTPTSYRTRQNRAQRFSVPAGETSFPKRDSNSHRNSLVLSFQSPTDGFDKSDRSKKK